MEQVLVASLSMDRIPFRFFLKPTIHRCLQNEWEIEQTDDVSIRSGHIARKIVDMVYRFIEGTTKHLIVSHTTLKSPQVNVSPLYEQMIDILKDVVDNPNNSVEYRE